MKISNYNFSTNKYKSKSTKPEDYDLNGIVDSLVNSSYKRLEQTKSSAPQINFETAASDNIYGNSGITDTNYNFLTNSEPATTLREGARIKNDAYEMLKDIYPEAKTKGIFDNIPDEEIEANIPKARELTQSAEKSNPGFSPNPFMQNAYSLFLASGMKGDKNATNLAYKLTHLQDMTNSSDNKNEGKSTEGKPVVNSYLYGNEDNTGNNFVNYSAQKSSELNPYGALDILKDWIPPSDGLSDVVKDIKDKDYVSAVIDIYRSMSSLRKRSPFEVTKDIARSVWKLGSELYLKPKGFTISAGMLEHSLQEKPEDVVFYEDSDVVKKIKADVDFNTKVDDLVKKIENNIPLSDEDESYEFNLGDLYYSIHGCDIYVDNISYNKDGTKDISIHLHDTYDYTKILTAMDGKKFSPSNVSLGTLANDAGTITSKFDAINPYEVDIYFTIRR